MVLIVAVLVAQEKTDLVERVTPGLEAWVFFICYMNIVY